MYMLPSKNASVRCLFVLAWTYCGSAPHLLTCGECDKPDLKVFGCPCGNEISEYMRVKVTRLFNRQGPFDSCNLGSYRTSDMLLSVYPNRGSSQKESGPKVHTT